jgi:hypothetical protein
VDGDVWKCVNERYGLIQNRLEVLEKLMEMNTQAR